MLVKSSALAGLDEGRSFKSTYDSAVMDLHARSVILRAVEEHNEEFGKWAPTESACRRLLAIADEIRSEISPASRFVFIQISGFNLTFLILFCAIGTGFVWLLWLAGLNFLIVAVMALSQNCPMCGRNVSYRGYGIHTSWPARNCTKCGHDLTKKIASE